MEETPLKGHSSSSAFNISAASGLRRRPRRSSSGPPHTSAPFDFENCLPPQQNFGISDHENFTGLSASSQVEQPRAPFDYENFPHTSAPFDFENWYTRMKRLRLRMTQHRDKELTLNVDGQWSKYAQTITKHNPSPRAYYRCSITPDYPVKKKVPQDLCMASLDHIYPIIGIDFTKSNEWTGKYSFNCRSLHHIGDTQNPYEQAISIIGRTLSSFNEDKIHCFGFGDVSTQDKHVFSFNPNKRPCNDVEEVLTRYREMATQLRLAGPTSFAPIIEMATAIVKQSDRQGHVLLIIADGQVTRSIDIEPGHLSPQEEKTIKAIEKASQHPLSIILVGVGDGPWDRVREFKDNIPTRAFDNFHFVNFTEIMSKNMPLSQKETEFAHAVLAEILSQYEAIVELNILGRRSGGVPMSDPSNLNVTVEQLAVNVIEDLVLLPPALKNNNAASFSSRPSHLHSFQASSSRHHEDTLSIQISPYHGHTPVAGTSPASASWDNQVCPICLTKPKDMAFGCGHQTCCKCGESLQSCPLCRRQIKIRIKLY